MEHRHLPLIAEILHQEVLYHSGSYKRIGYYLRGWHPKLGTLRMGWSGPETLVEIDAIHPIATYEVKEDKSAGQ